MERKWYNFETIFSTAAEHFHNFLQELNYKHEISMAGNSYHFEICLNEEEKRIVDGYLLSL